MTTEAMRSDQSVVSRAIAESVSDGEAQAAAATQRRFSANEPKPRQQARRDPSSRVEHRVSGARCETQRRGRLLFEQRCEIERSETRRDSERCESTRVEDMSRSSRRRLRNVHFGDGFGASRQKCAEGLCPRCLSREQRGFVHRRSGEKNVRRELEGSRVPQSRGAAPGDGRAVPTAGNGDGGGDDRTTESSPSGSLAVERRTRVISLRAKLREQHRGSAPRDAGDSEARRDRGIIAAKRRWLRAQHTRERAHPTSRPQGEHAGCSCFSGALGRGACAARATYARRRRASVAERRCGRSVGCAKRERCSSSRWSPKANPSRALAVSDRSSSIPCA